MGSMTFGDALVALKAGGRVCRAGWNGKGMWLYLIPAEVMAVVGSVTRGGSEGKFLRCDPCASIAMKTADNKIVVGWLASQTDMLAEDWMIAE